MYNSHAKEVLGMIQVCDVVRAQFIQFSPRNDALKQVVFKMAILSLSLQEKESQMPEDLGKDINSVDRLKRLHETFEADLAPLEKHVST